MGVGGVSFIFILGGHPQIPSCLIVLCSGEPGAGRKGAVSNSTLQRGVGLVNKRRALLRVLGWVSRMKAPWIRGLKDPPPGS